MTGPVETSVEDPPPPEPIHLAKNILTQPGNPVTSTRCSSTNLKLAF